MMNLRMLFAAATNALIERTNVRKGRTSIPLEDTGNRRTIRYDTPKSRNRAARRRGEITARQQRRGAKAAWQTGEGT